MVFDEYGRPELPALVLVHGAIFVDTFARSYSLSEQFHLIVPHLTGFGAEVDTVFSPETAVSGLLKVCERFGPVYLAGFSIGAQVAFKLVTEHPETVKKAVLVSPWLVNKHPIPAKMVERNLSMLKWMKRPAVCKLLGRMNGIPKDRLDAFASNTRRISETTVRNMVDNGITLDGAPCCSVPILALAGERESDNVRGSVRRMAERYPNCTCQIWQGAKHNIPMAYARRLNETLTEFFR